MHRTQTYFEVLQDGDIWISVSTFLGFDELLIDPGYRGEGNDWTFVNSRCSGVNMVIIHDVSSYFRTAQASSHLAFNYLVSWLFHKT